MKLIFCPVCLDVRKLQYEQVTCKCEACWGNYKRDGLNATIGGMAIPLGFQNSSFVDAVMHRPKEGRGLEFEAFVIPVECETCKHVDNPS